MKKYNILLLYADQHRGMDLHCAGNPQLSTPNLDRLAREGTYFQNGIANCPVCTPSRAILLTGKYPLSNGTLVNDLPLSTGQDTLATLLRAQGYKTGYIGKWHLDGIPRSKFTPPGPRRQGFNDFWAVYNCHHNYFAAKYYLDNPELIQLRGYEPDIQTDLALHFIEQNKENPFCLMLSWGPPHAPYHLVPKKYRNQYPRKEVDVRYNALDASQRTVGDYYAAITALDHNVGLLLQALEEKGLRENTIVLYTSDHGDMLYSHGRIKKQQPWEESIHVPLIMSAPGLIPANQRLDTLIGSADITPTLLGLLGVEIPEAMQGMDRSPIIQKQSDEEYASVPIMDIVPADQSNRWYGREWRGVRTKRYTYARWREMEWVLYDNQEDPYQLRNLIYDPEYYSLRRRLEEELQQWLDRLGDRFLSAEEHLRELGQYQKYVERQKHFHSGDHW